MQTFLLIGRRNSKENETVRGDRLILGTRNKAVGTNRQYRYMKCSSKVTILHNRKRNSHIARRRRLLKQSHRQTLSTFAQSAFSGGTKEKSQSGPRNEGTSSRRPCYNCGEEGHFSCNCPNQANDPHLQTQTQTQPKFQP